MALASFVQSSFLGGAWSQSMQGRIDRPDYRTSMKVCLNSLPLEGGAWSRRSGTYHGAHTKAGLAGRVITFPFKQQQPYTLEFTNGYLRYFSGKTLAKTNDAQAVLSISAANPAKVATAVHGWTGTFTAMFDSFGVNNPLLHNRQFLATVTSTTEFTLADAVTGTAIDGSTLGTFVSGNVSRVLETTTPYVSGLWGTVRSIHAETNAIFLQATVPPYILQVTAVPTDTTYATFSLGAVTFFDGPYLDPFTNGVQVTPSALTGIINLSLGFAAYSATKAYDIGDYVLSASITYRSLVTANLNHTPASSPTQWVAVSAYEAIGPNGFVGSDIGRHIRIYSEPALWVVGTSYSIGNVVAYVDTNGNTAYYTNLTAGAATAQNAPGISATTWGINASGAIWTWGKITALLNQIAQGTGSNIGTMTSGGGLAAAFDGTISQTQAASANHSTTGAFNYSTSVAVTASVNVGKNYTSSAQKILSATLYPASDVGFASASITATNFLDTAIAVTNITVNLRAKATAPASPSDGTLLGTTGTFTNTTNAATINSSDTTTSWNYVWFEIIAVCTISTANPGSNVGNYQITINAAEAQFFSASTGTGNGVTVQILGSDLLYTLPVRTWRLGVYNGAGYPTCGTYHEGRIWLAGSVNNRLDASQPIDTNRPGVLNFAPTLANGAVTAAQAINYTLRAPNTNTILWLEPDQQGIIVGTEAGEWLVQSATKDGPITPLSLTARRVTKIGCANALPVKTEHTTVFIQRYKRKTMEYFADVYSGKFSAPNLALTAKHLTKRGLEELAYQQELTPVVWARCTDGSLLGTTYKRESLISSQGPTFAGWHEHTLGSGRTVTSISGGPSADGLLDTLVMVTNDGVGGPYHIEFLGNFWEEGDDVADGWMVDDGIVPSATQNAVVSGNNSLQCFGLWHLNGLTVSVVCGGLDLGDYLVTAGTLAVPYLSTVADGLFTTAFSAGKTVVVGHTFTSDGQIARPALQQETGARTGPGLGKIRRTHSIAPLLVDTQAISFGTEFATAKMNAGLFKTPGGTDYDQNELFSGTWLHKLTDSPSRDGAVCWRVTRPYPATIAAMVAMLETTDE